MKKMRIVYMIYLLLLLGVCALCVTDVLDKNMVITVDILLIAVVFFCCSSIFYLPRNMDHGVFLENKQKMKSDPILWKEMLFLETPLVIGLLVLLLL